MNAQYLDPVFGRGYPAELFDHYRRVSDLTFVRDGDLETIARPIDLLGVNYYRRHTVTASRPPDGLAEELPGSLGSLVDRPAGRRRHRDALAHRAGGAHRAAAWLSSASTRPLGS